MMEYKYLTLVLFLMVFVRNCDLANILCIFPAPSFSRQQPMLTLSRALAEKGHNLTVITTSPSKVPLKNHRDIDISFIIKFYSELQSKTKFNLQKRSSDSYKFIDSLPLMLEFVCSTILGSPQIKEYIKEIKDNNYKYDSIIIEDLFHLSLLGFVDILGNPPVIGIHTYYIASPISSRYGNPVTPSYIPCLTLPFSDEMSFFERIRNLFMVIYFDLLMTIYNTSIQQKLMEKHFGKLKYSADEMDRNKSLLLAIGDLSTGYPKPANPNTIFTGPLHIGTTEKLPEDLKKWMDDAKDGVVYFSFGSNMKGTSVPEEIRITFIKVFSQFPNLRFLWKWEGDGKLPGQSDNILTKKWLPQQSILAHPNLKLFISQVGLQSFQEAIHYNIPILGIPMYGDQEFNAKKLVHSGAGLQLEFNDINFETVYENLKELLTNMSYKENMARLSKISNDKPMSSIDTAIWWIEYVIRHNGAKHLRPASLDLYWFQYFMLDIALFLLAVLLLSLFVIYFILRKLIGMFSKQKFKIS